MIKIEPLIHSHLKNLDSLVSQLGYTIIEEQLLKDIISDCNHYCFVAMIESNVVGFIHALKAIRITSSPFLEIVGLIVDQKHRRNGIGKMLVNQIEQLASKQSLKIRVRCNTKRDEAHIFYNQLSFNLIKEQKVYIK